MSGVLRSLLRLLVRAHPPAWRRRYAEEVAQVIGDLDPRPSDVGDLARSALAAHRAATLGGSSMPSPTNPWPARVLAVGALLLAAWTAVFIGFNVLRWNLGVAIDPSLAWTYNATSPIPAMLGVLGPALIGLVLALAGMLRGERHSTGGPGAAFLVRVRPTRLTIIAAAACLAVMLVIGGYVVSENVLEAIR